MGQYRALVFFSRRIMLAKHLLHEVHVDVHTGIGQSREWVG